MKNKHDNVIGQLHKLSSFVQSKNFNTAEEITKTLRIQLIQWSTHKTLLKTYQNHFIKTVRNSLAKLARVGGPLS